MKRIALCFMLSFALITCPVMAEETEETASVTEQKEEIEKYDEAADEVLKAAFGDRAVFDGTSYVLKPGISRKKEMVPAITDVLEASPKE